MTRQVITLQGATPAIAPWQVPATVFGTIAVHRSGHPASNCPVRLQRYRLTHIPSGAKVWDVDEYRVACQIAKRIGTDPAFGAQLRTEQTKAERARAFQVLQAAVREVTGS